MKVPIPIQTFLLLICLLTVPQTSLSQEEAATVYYSKKYLDLNIKSLDKYSHRIAKQQQKLLKKLKKKEEKFASRLKKKDSLGFVRYQQQSLTYDSISKLTEPDSSTLASRFSRKKNAAIDSLKGVQSFLQSTASKAIIDNPTSNKGDKLNDLQQQLNHQEYIDNLISQRTNNLKSITSGSKEKMPALKSIKKNVFYGKGRMQVYKDIANEPSKLEDKALEYLQGQEGFDSYLQGESNNSNTLQAMTGSGNVTAADLEKMGYQTKRQLNAQLQKRFGNNIDAVQEQVGSQIKDFQDKAKELQSVKSTVKQTKNSIKGIRNTERPSFKVNPMRSLPFWQRIEKQYNWQVNRAADDQPAILQLSAMAGFKHTPRLTYGIGLATSMGLGENWNNVKITLEGIGLRTFAEWEWQYGIGAYAGYERMFKQAIFKNNSNQEINIEEPTPHNTNTYNESILLGLTKSYRINEKWNGAVQVLYDVWWREKGLRTPIILRFSTSK